MSVRVPPLEVVYYADIQCPVPTAGKELHIEGQLHPVGHCRTGRTGRAWNDLAITYGIM